MIPWPLAALSMLYGSLAFLSAVHLMTCLAQRDVVSSIWLVLWLAVTAGACIGLPGQKEWGRRCALAGALLFLVTAIVVAFMALLVSPPQPRVALTVTLLAGAPMIILRYLRRPVVKAQFQQTQS